MVKKLLLLCFLLVTVTVQAEVYVVDDFSKLLQSHINPYIIPKGAALEARNVRSNDVYGSLAKRKAMNQYGSIGSTSVTSLHRYYQSDGTAILLATGSTYILSGDDDAGTFTILRDELTTGLRWSWVTYKDMAIGGNGTDRTQKYDGHTQTTANTDGSRTASILTADLGAPFAEQNTGANLDASKWYQYKMMFTDGSTNWYSEAVSNPILTGSTVRDISLTDIPLGPSGTTSRIIYRTEGQATRAALSSATFKLMATIANNTATTANDAIADGALTTTWSTSGKTALTPPITKYLILHKERLFGANAPNLGSYVYWSYAFKPDIFDVADYDYVRVDDGDVITGQVEMLGKLVYFKTNSITNFETQNSDDTKWQFFTYEHTGCPAPWSIAYSPTGIFYLGWDGIYIYNGENAQLASDAVTKDVKDVSVANISNSVGTFFENEYQLAYTSESSGESVNNSVLVFDSTRNAYVLDDKNIGSFCVFNSGSDFGTLYSGSSTTDGKVLAHDTSLSTYIVKTKSAINEGTKSSLTVSGTDANPVVSLGWGIYINDTSMSAVTLGSLTYSTATINRESLTGTWWSPAIEVNASDYENLYWNETLGGAGNITFALRSAASATAATADALAWSSEYSNPAGSDVSGLTTNDFLQLRGSFSTTDITESPELYSLNNYVIKLIYSKSGTVAETVIESVWKSGFTDFGVPTIPKLIQKIDMYYLGTSGTLTVGLKNSRGDIDQSFEIDLSVDPESSEEDQYFGNNTYKVYKWLSELNSEEVPSPIGRKWQFSFEESGVTGWNIYMMVITYEGQKYYDD